MEDVKHSSHPLLFDMTIALFCKSDVACVMLSINKLNDADEDRSAF